MIQPSKSAEELAQENDLLLARLEEAQEILTAIRTGAVDAVVVEGPTGEQVFTLEGADHPYRIFVETMNEGAVTLAGDETIVYCNRLFADLVGLPLEQTLGRNVLDFIRPADRPAIESLLKQADEVGVRSEVSIEQPDGVAIPVRISARHLPEKYGNCLCLVITDLRGHKLQEALFKSEAQLEAELTDTKLLQSISAQLITEENVADLYARILDAAVAIMRSEYASMQMFCPERGSGGELRLLAFRGFNPEAAKFWEWVHADSGSTCGVALRTGKRVIVANVEQCDFMAGTEDLAVYLQTGIHAVQSTPLVSRNGKILGMISTHWRNQHHPAERNLRLLDILARQAADLMERRHAEEGLRQWNTDLEREVTRRTVELLESRERLRALATELNLAEQRERKRVAIELHDYLAQLLVLAKMKLGQGKRLAGSVPACAAYIKQSEDVLTEALIYTRTLVADLSPPVLRDFGLPTALQWLGEQMQRHQLNVTVNLSESDHMKLPEDQALLMFQSVRELLINASKYGGSGEATVSLTQCDGELRVEVRDQGQGFDMTEKAAAVTEKFGLFSIRERMQALGGSFELDSGVGEGTRATLVLPLDGGAVINSELKALNSQLSEATISQPSNRNLQSGNSEFETQDSTLKKNGTIRVLLVDDHAMVRQGLRSVLDSYADIEVVGEASNGEEAIAGVVTHQPAVVVMDINMPKLNGIDATSRIKSHYANTIVIGLSVQAGGEMQQAMLKAGAACLLTKEAAVDQLYQTIQGAYQETGKK